MAEALKNPMGLEFAKEIDKLLATSTEIFQPSIPAEHRLLLNTDVRELCRSVVAAIDAEDLEPNRKFMDEMTRKMAQFRLKDAGFDPGPIDGKLGIQTKEALRQFQQRQGLRVTGELDDASRKALGIE